MEKKLDRIIELLEIIADKKQKRAGKVAVNHRLPADVNLLLIQFCRIHNDKLGVQYATRFGEDRAHLKRMVGVYGTATVGTIIDMYFALRNDYRIEREGYSIRQLATRTDIPILLKKYQSYVSQGDEGQGDHSECEDQRQDQSI